MLTSAIILAGGYSKVVFCGQWL